MSSALDKSLDEIVADRKQNRPGRDGRRGRGAPRQPEIRRSTSGIQKHRSAPYSSYATRGNADAAWTHDLYEPHGNQNRRLANNPLAVRLGDVTTTPGRLKVENLHYELTEADLTDLFQKVGSVQSLHLQYDKLGRSDGIAYVTFTHLDDAKEAIRKYNGAKAAGQHITVTLLEHEERRTNAPRPPRPQPGGGRFTRGGAPMRRGGGPRRRGGGGRTGGGERRPHRTQEDLDRELDDYLSGGVAGNGDVEGGSGGAAATVGDEMVLD